MITILLYSPMVVQVSNLLLALLFIALYIYDALDIPLLKSQNVLILN